MEHVGNGASITLEIITPEKALEYLSHRNPDNRLIRPRKVKEYVSDMLSGNWDTTTTDNAISFNEDGVLVNGHHRLTAIAQAGVPLKMWVWRGVSRNAKIFDRAAMRSTVDILNMDGIGRDIANNLTVSVVKYLFNFVFNKKVHTDSHVMNYLILHDDDIVNATRVTTHGRASRSLITRSAPLSAVAYCALRYGISAERLDMFFRIVNTGIPYEKWQTSPIHLRNYLMEMRKDELVGMKDKNSRQLVQSMGESALWDFTQNRERKTGYKREIKSGKFSEYVKKVDEEEIRSIFGVR